MRDAPSSEDSVTMPPAVGRGSSWALLLAVNLVLTMGYTALGIASLRLILPQDFAAPVYPAAGLAVAAALRWGTGVLPGVAFGSFFVTMTLAASRGQIQWMTAVVIAFGAASQAGLGAALARRWVGPQPRLTEPRELLRFFGAIAGLACLISPTVATTTLWLSATITDAQVAAHWLSWWIGDAIGVLLAAPIALSLFGLPRAHWAPRRLAVALPLLCACALLSAAAFYIARNEDNRQRHSFEVAAELGLDSLGEALRRPLVALDANHSVLRVAPHLSRAEFERAHAERVSDNESVYALGWIARVTPSQRDAFERAARQEDYPDFMVRERQRPGDLPIDAQDDLMVVRLIVPWTRNRGALGVNVRAIPQSRTAQDLAIASGLPQASEAFPLSQDTGTHAIGVVVYRALRGEPAASQGADPRGELHGLTFATLRPELLLREAMAAQAHHTAPSAPASAPAAGAHAMSSPAAALEHQGEAPTAPMLDFCLLDDTPGVARPLIAGDPRCAALPDSLPHLERSLDFAGRDWRLVVYAPQGLPPPDRSASLPFALAGLFGTGLLGMLLLIVTGRAARVAQLVDEGTRRLRESEERFRSIVEHAPVGVVFADLKARPQEINPYFCQLLGYTAQELKEKSILKITHPDDRAEDNRLGTALLRGDLDRYSRIKRYIGKEGQVITVRSTVSLLRDANGEPHRLVGVVEDIGEQLRLEALELEHETELAANRAKSEFLSRMSHELRTPLNAMLGFAQLLEVDPEASLTARQRDWLGRIQQSGWHLLAMINDTLDLSRLEVGQMRVRIDDLALDGIVSDSLAMVETQRQRRHIRLEVELDEDASQVRADATRLRQVLTNLLSNAIKYNREGGEIRLRAERRGERVHLSVADTGAGLTETQLAQLFQPFNRLGREVSGIEGTGIGLVITQRLLELMDSRLEVTSTPGVGSTFRFDLPCPTASAGLET
ncbi:ATP-binding protein [Roseateles amylovorans]|uniref:histidine kinase n=1 Tax=Roseateles amylovorans TaxID=2978473 RepID=A0ABY6AWW2_9BURK|nr:ATP-binding protein [Roseateles amylovorans]UXH77666.1 CHASE domain-containing protein [Roseateles amylovorans]